MKLTIFIILLSVITVFAGNTYSQTKTLNLNVKNSTVKEVLQSIEQQSEFVFMYSEKLVDVNREVSVNIKNQKINEVLDELFAGTNVNYKVRDRFILLSTPEAYGYDFMVQQQNSVSGKVTDTGGQPLPGVTVVVKGTTHGTMTNADGNYSLTNIPKDATLVFSFVGMLSQEVVVGSQTSINVVMAEDIIGIEEVVAVGYQTMRKSDITGSVATVSPGDIDGIPVHNPLKALQGRLAGLHITKDGTPGGGTRSVLIRGYNTLGNNDPLFIIDGQPVTGYPGSQALDFMNSNDIESIQVLKDGAAASIYGSRASGGVILINTKKASSGIKIDLRSSATLENFYNKSEMLNTEQRGITYWQASVNDGRDPNTDNAHYTYNWGYDDQGNPILHSMETVEWLDRNVQGGIRASDTDWFNEMTRPGYIIQNNVSISKGGNDHSILFSVGHHYNQGAIKFIDYQRTSVRINSSIDLLNKRLTIGENFQFVTSERTPMGSGQGGSTYGLGYITSPIIPVYAEDGSFAGPVGADLPNRENPIAVAHHTKNYRNNMRQFFGNMYLNLTVIKDLEFRSNLGIDYRDREHLQYDPTWQAGFLKEEFARYSRSLPQDYSWTWHNTFNYDLEKEKHRLNVLLGMEAIAHTSSSFEIQREGYIIETTDYMNASSGTGSYTVSGSSSGHQLLSYFSKLSYSFYRKYLLSTTLRYDGSSRFGQNTRWGFFPAASIGWRISSEEFLSSIDFMSNLLLRTGVGRTGNQEIGNNAAFGLYRPAYDRLRNLWQSGSAYDITGSNSGTLPSGVVANQLPNPNLRWEQTDELNIGLDFVFFENSLTGSLDYFFRKTSDILVQPPFMAVIGEAGSQWQNGATMENKGWEFQIGYRNKKNDFSYNFNSTFASFKDEVTYVPESTIRAYPGNVEKTIIGHSISSLFGYVTDGIFQNQEEVNAHATQFGKKIGRIRYQDLNDDGVINELDQTWLGTTIPDLEYGLNISLGYKNFSLTTFFQGVYGLTLSNGNEARNVLIGGTLAGQNQSVRALDAWTPQNPNSKIPALSRLDDNNETRPSDFMIQNASYLKLRNIQLSYSLPDYIINQVKMKKAEIFIAGSEIFTIMSKDWTGTDPENPGSNYPITRGITLGINLSF